MCAPKLFSKEGQLYGIGASYKPIPGMIGPPILLYGATHQVAGTWPTPGGPYNHTAHCNCIGDDGCYWVANKVFSWAMRMRYSYMLSEPSVWGPYGVGRSPLLAEDCTGTGPSPDPPGGGGWLPGPGPPPPPGIIGDPRDTDWTLYLDGSEIML